MQRIVKNGIYDNLIRHFFRIKLSCLSFSYSLYNLLLSSLFFIFFIFFIFPSTSGNFLSFPVYFFPSSFSFLPLSYLLSLFFSIPSSALSPGHRSKLVRPSHPTPLSPSPPYCQHVHSAMDGCPAFRCR